MSEFDDFMAKVEAFFADLFTAAGKLAITFLSSLAKEMVASGGALLQDAAKSAVLAAETQGGSGKDKFNAAYDAVVGTLENAGVPVIVNAVQGAIIGAVAEMNANK